MVFLELSLKYHFKGSGEDFFYKDKNGDSKVQLNEINYLHLGGAVAVLAILLKLEIVDFNVVIELIKVLMG